MRRASAAVFAIFVIAFATPATATEPPEAVARARAELAAGVALYDHDDYDGALVHFRAAYAAKPSPVIQQNIALCLRALRRNAEAMDALDGLLASDVLDARTRDAASRALADLEPKVARLKIEITFTAREARVPPAVEVTLDGAPVDPSRLARPLRVEPGDHVVHARAAGHSDANVRVALAAGQPPAIVSIELAPVPQAMARLHLTANYPDADIAIDGVALAHGEWSGALPAGRHALDVGSPVARYTNEVTLAAGDARDLHVVLTRAGAWAYVAGPSGAAGPMVPQVLAAGASPAPSAAPPVPSAAPPPYEGEDLPPARRTLRSYLPSHLYLGGGAAIHAMSAALSPALQDASGAPRSFVGGSFVFRTGASLTPWFQLGGLGEVGATTSDTFLTPARAESRVAAVVWSLAPEVRFRTMGRIRGFAGFGIGMTGLHVTSSGAARATPGAGIGLLATGEAGVQTDLGTSGFYGELAAFGDIRDLGSGLFSDATAARFGLRIAIGREF